MILVIPPDTPPEYMHGIYLAWILMIILFIVMGSAIFFKRAKEADTETQKWVFFGYGMFGLGMGLCRVFFILAFNDVWGEYQLLLHIGFLFGSISFTPIIYVYEKYIVKNTKKVFSIIAIVLLGISVYGVIDPTQKTLDVISQRIGGPICGITFAYLYLVMLKNTSGELRRNSWLMLIGMLFIAFGIILDSFEIVINPAIPLWLSPGLFLLGGFLVALTQRKKKSSSEAEPTPSKSSSPKPVNTPKSSNPKPVNTPKSESSNDGWN